VCCSGPQDSFDFRQVLYLPELVGTTKPAEAGNKSLKNVMNSQHALHFPGMLPASPQNNPHPLLSG